MQNDGPNRRLFLKTMSSAGMLAALPEAAFGLPPGGDHVVHEIVEPSQDGDAKPKYSIKFAVCGMSHDHIHGMIGAVQRGGGVLVAAWGGEEDKLATFKKRYPDVKIVATQDEIINDPSIQLVLSSQIANERAAIGIRAMKHGKDFLSDKPGVTTLEELAAMRKTIEETKKIYAHHVQRAARGESRGQGRRAGQGGRHRPRHPDHQHRAAPDHSGARR